MHGISTEQPFWRCARQAGENASISLDTVSDHLDPLLTLYSVEGQVIDQNDDFGDTLNSRIDVILPATDRHVILTGTVRGAGAYTLSLTMAAVAAKFAVRPIFA